MILTDKQLKRLASVAKAAYLSIPVESAAPDARWVKVVGKVAREFAAMVVQQEVMQP